MKLFCFLLVCVCSQLIAKEVPPAVQEIKTPEATLKIERLDVTSTAVPSENHSTICLNMIVKNETKVICRCLESVKPFIDYWVIVDTGSTDGTQEMIKEFMKDIPGELHERPWVNFSHNRNEALSLARGKSDYIFFIDADDKIEISPNFRKKQLFDDSYMIDIKYGGMTYGRIAVVKDDLPWEWKGAVHEVLVCYEAGPSGHLDDVIMRIIGGGDRSQDPKKFLRDAALLEKELEKDPTHARSQFYLAQSYRDAENPELALAHYQKRVDMGGWDQEVFWSLYQIAHLKEQLQKPESEIVKAYTRAYLYRPTRLEPLHGLCAYYRRQENYLMGYLIGQLGLKAFAKVGIRSMAHPLFDSSLMPDQMELVEAKDPLFIESWVYDYAFLLEHSICAYWLGKYQESKDICEFLLAKPDLPTHVRDCVKRNLKFANDKLAERMSTPVLLKAG